MHTITVTTIQIALVVLALVAIGANAALTYGLSIDGGYSVLAAFFHGVASVVTSAGVLTTLWLCTETFRLARRHV